MKKSIIMLLTGILIIVVFILIQLRVSYKQEEERLYKEDLRHQNQQWLDREQAKRDASEAESKAVHESLNKELEHQIAELDKQIKDTLKGK